MTDVPGGEDVFRGLYERAPCGLLTTESNGTIVAVNDTFLRWTGFERTDLVGRRAFASLLSGGGRIYHETHFAPTLQMQGFAREIAFDLVCADRRRLSVLVNATAEKSDDGSVVSLDVAVFAATERRLYERELLAAKQRAESSEAHARLLVQTLQRTLVPQSLPTIPGLELAAAYRPSGDGHELGGDFYDVFQIGLDDWVLVIGDVQGKGVGAAIVTALARHTIRAAAVEHDQPSAMLRLLNDVLLRDDSDRYCTAAVLRCRRRDGIWQITTSCAGHPPPLRVGATGATTEIGRYGTAAGLLTEVQLHDIHTSLAPGDLILAYTDGVTEARRGAEFFGEQRLRGYLQNRDPGQSIEVVAQALLDQAVDFQRGVVGDDIAVLALRVMSPKLDEQTPTAIGNPLR